MVHSSIGVGYLTVSQKRGVQLPYEPPPEQMEQFYVRLTDLKVTICLTWI